MTEQELIERAAAEHRILGDLQQDRAPAEAELSYRRALALVPGAADAHAALAATLLRLNRLCEGAGHLARALLLDPAHDAASLLWAELLAAQGRVPEAFHSLEDALERGAGAAHLVAAADLLARLGLVRPAEAAYRAALDREEHLEGRTNLAVLLAGRGRLDEALAELDRVLAIAPEVVEAQLNRANVLVELGRLDEAESAFERLRLGHATRAAALWGIGHIRTLQGDGSGAADLRAAAIEADPELASACTVPASRAPLPAGV